MLQISNNICKIYQTTCLNWQWMILVSWESPQTVWDDDLNSESHQSNLIDGEFFPGDELR